MGRALTSRREFLALSAGALLTSCITRRFSPPPDEQPRSAAGPLERELHIYNWSDYVGPHTISDFEREFGVAVSYDTYENNEEMIAKLVAGGGGYDIIGPSSYLVPVLAEGGLLQPLDHQVLTGWGNLNPYFVDQGSGSGGKYALPYQWGYTGIASRPDLIGAAPTSWGVFQDGALRDRMTMLDDGREVLGAMLRWRGHSLNSVDRAELARAREDAIAARANLRAYVSAPVKGQLISGDVAVAQMWSSDARTAQRDEPRIAFEVPAEGSTVYTDCLAIPREAPNRRAAHAFLNYLLRPRVIADVTMATGGGCPNLAALPLIDRPMLPPDAALGARLEFQRDLGPATDLWDRFWTEVKAG
jgi:spermidine/putrescine transport system substrate-binding protein